MKTIVLSIYSLLLLGIFCQAQNENKWITDIDYYHKTLEEKHINLYHTISKEEFSAEIANLKSRLPSLTDFQVVVELMQLTHKVGAGKGDGHTSVPLWGRNLNRYPIKLFDFDGELRVLGTDKRQKQLLGKILISIDGVSIEEIYSKVSKLTPFTENKQSAMDRTCSYMLNAEILKAIGIVKKVEQAEFKFVDDNGIYSSVILKSYSKDALTSIAYEALTISHPSIIPPEDSKFKKLWFTSLDHSKTVFINFKQYPSKKDMNEFSKNVYTFIQQHQSTSLIIDLRDNYGGDFFKGLDLISWLNLADSIDWSSKVYVLINRSTFSASMVNAVQFRQILNAKVIGEPSGANPNGYQDMGQFNLPNSNLGITYSKRIFHLQDSNSQGIRPFVLISPSWEDYKNGRDEVIYWVLKDLHKSVLKGQ